MKHIVCVQIAQSEFDRVNRLLAIPSLEEMTDGELLACGANTDDCEGILYAVFDDGSWLSYDLCSGSENYYDDVVWRSPNEDHEVSLECTYELGGSIEFTVDGEEYIVIIKPIRLSMED